MAGHDNALNDRGWAQGAHVEHEPREVMVVHSARFPRELSRLLEDEATRRGITPSELLRRFVEDALSGSAPVRDEVVTVNPAELRQRVADAVESALRRPAA